MKPLQDRVAVVAGASRGIGMGAAIELGAAGAFVYALGRTLRAGTGGAAGSLDETVEAIEADGGKAQAVACDCADPDALARLFAEVEARHGRLDILVNSVFASHDFGRLIGKRLWELPPEIWRDVVDVPGRAAYFATALAAPLMMRSATQGDGGLIVNISGRGALRYRYNTAYGVGKSAIARLNRDSAIELKPHDIAVVALWPNGHAPDRAYGETPRYNGRAVVALAADRQRMDRTGQHYWSAELAADYGFTDEFGRSHPVGELTDSYSLEHDGVS
jgi:NAD(P)-dependent dehydrogenase (short-subunit alcohol dehydrogenase family)